MGKNIILLLVKSYSSIKYIHEENENTPSICH